MKKKATFHRLLGYMWRYRIVSCMALTFILLTTLVTTALPLLARYFIDQFIGRNQAWAGLPLLALYYGFFLLRVLFTFLGKYFFVYVFRYPEDRDRDFVKRIIAVPGDYSDRKSVV